MINIKFNFAITLSIEINLVEKLFVPGVPSTPGIPSTPGVPSIPLVPSVPSIPGGPRNPPEHKADILSKYADKLFHRRENRLISN